MKKKFVAMSLAMTFCLASLTACGDKTEPAPAEQQSEQEEEEKPAEETAESEEAEAEPEEEAEPEVVFEGTEISTHIEVSGWKFNVAVTVPDGSDYSFVDENPTEGWFLGGDGATGFISGDVCFSFVPWNYPSSVTAETFGELADVMMSDDNPTTMKPVERLEIGGRDALCFEWRWGDSPAPLHGYKYWVDASDALGENGKGMYVEVRTLPLDGELDSDAVAALYTDETIQNIIKSITITAGE